MGGGRGEDGGKGKMGGGGEDVWAMGRWGGGKDGGRGGEGKRADRQKPCLDRSHIPRETGHRGDILIPCWQVVSSWIVSL